MKICFVGMGFNLFSGTSKPIYDIATTLSQMDIDVTLLTTGIDSKLEKEHSNLVKRQKTFDINIVNSFNIYKNNITKNKDLETIRDVVKSCDLIHGFDFLSLYEMKLFMNKSNLSKPLIYSATGSYRLGIKDMMNSGFPSLLNMKKISFFSKFLIPDIVFEKIFNNFDKIITNSEFIKHEIKSMGIKEEKIENMPVGINVEHLDKFNLSVNPIKFDFIYFGWGSSIRGVPDLIKAFDIVLKNHADAKLGLFFLGSHGIEEKMYTSLIKNNKNFGNSIYLSVGVKMDMMNIIKSSKSVVLPFRSHFGYSQPPLTILESMMLKKPVISTNIGSIPEIISDGENGYLVNPRNPWELAKKMLDVMDDKSKDISKNARKYVIKTHNIRNTSKEILDIYQNV